jgi:hypothetical protein
LASKFNVNEIDFEFLVGLDSDQERRATSSGDDLVGEVDRLEDKGKRSFEFFENSLDEPVKVIRLSG